MTIDELYDNPCYKLAMAVVQSELPETIRELGFNALQHLQDQLNKCTNQPVEKSMLLPCPFCGSQAILDDSTAGSTVVCSECGAEPRHLPLHHDQTKREAYAVWNTRSTPKREAPVDCWKTFEEWFAITQQEHRIIAQHEITRSEYDFMRQAWQAAMNVRPEQVKERETQQPIDFRKDFEYECPVFNFAMHPAGYGYLSTVTEQAYKCFKAGRGTSPEREAVTLDVPELDFAVYKMLDGYWKHPKTHMSNDSANVVTFQMALRMLESLLETYELRRRGSHA
jgi:Lar family restriction alleviation protein